MSRIKNFDPGPRTKGKSRRKSPRVPRENLLESIRDCLLHVLACQVCPVCKSSGVVQVSEEKVVELRAHREDHGALEACPQCALAAVECPTAPCACRLGAFQFLAEFDS